MEGHFSPDYLQQLADAEVYSTEPAPLASHLGEQPVDHGPFLQGPSTWQHFPAQHSLSAPGARHVGPLVVIPLCRKGDRAGIERTLQSGDGSVDELDVEGNTPLHVAVEAPKNELATVQCLLEHGANINVVNHLGAAPLHYVCLRKANHRGIANVLLENGAIINCQTLAGKTPLHFACEQQQFELVEVLCLFGADPNIPDIEGNLPIHLCLAKPGGRDTVKRQILEQLVCCGASFQTPNLEGQMPIHMACRGGFIRCAQLLVEQRADVSSLTSRGETGMHLACQSNHAEVTQLLLQTTPHIVDLPDINGNTSLHVCAMNGALDCAVLILRMGADTKLRNSSSRTAFDLAKIRGTDLNSMHNAELEMILKESARGGGCNQS